MYGGVLTGCKEKRAGRAKFVVLHLLFGPVSFDVLVAVALVVAPRIY